MTAASHPRRLGDRYELLEPIGYGGMGHVYRAHDVVLDREVAVKLLDAEAGVEDDSMRGAMDEARLAAKLAHPGIAHVFDVGTQDDESYVVMELVPGRSLRELMRERGTFAAAEAIELGAQLADALHDAHRNGVVHCDVKPENIIVTPQGRTKLVDFGIARATAATRTLPVAAIRQQVGIPIAGGEHEYTRWGLKQLMDADAVDVLQPDIYWAGGITDMLKICALASNYDLPVIPHGHSTPASAHLIASQPVSTCPLLEYLVKWNEVHQFFLKTPLKPDKGVVRVPEDAPGIGMDLDEAKIDERRVLSWRSD